MAVIREQRSDLKEQRNHHCKHMLYGYGLLILTGLSIIFSVVGIDLGISIPFWFKLLLAFIFIMYSSYHSNQFSILSAGIAGEEEALAEIIHLSDDYTVLSNVTCMYQEKKCEIDMLIVAPNGIFIVEVKNHNGIIEGGINNPMWIQHKVGRNGGEYSKEIRNPLLQVKRSTYILSNYLKDSGYNVWIEGIVFYTNPEVSINVDDNKKIFIDGFLARKYIQEFVSKQKINFTTMKEIIYLLNRG